MLGRKHHLLRPLSPMQPSFDAGAYHFLLLTAVTKSSENVGVSIFQSYMLHPSPVSCFDDLQNPAQPTKVCLDPTATQKIFHFAITCWLPG